MNRMYIVICLMKFMIRNINFPEILYFTKQTKGELYISIYHMLCAHVN